MKQAMLSFSYLGIDRLISDRVDLQKDINVLKEEYDKVVTESIMLVNVIKIEDDEFWENSNLAVEE